MDTETMAKEVLEEGKAVFSRIKTIHGIDGALSALPEVVKAVEAKAAAVCGLSGEEKKELAVEIINALVDIPYLPESLEAKLIGFGVDAAVAALNKIFGKNWLESSTAAAQA